MIILTKIEPWLKIKISPKMHFPIKIIISAKNYNSMIKFRKSQNSTEFILHMDPNFSDLLLYKKHMIHVTGFFCDNVTVKLTLSFPGLSISQ